MGHMWAHMDPHGTHLSPYGTGHAADGGQPRGGGAVAASQESIFRCLTFKFGRTHLPFYLDRNPQRSTTSQIIAMKDEMISIKWREGMCPTDGRILEAWQGETLAVQPGYSPGENYPSVTLTRLWGTDGFLSLYGSTGQFDAGIVFVCIFEDFKEMMLKLEIVFLLNLLKSLL